MTEPLVKSISTSGLTTALQPIANPKGQGQGLGLRGEAVVTVRDHRGRVKGQQTINNSLTDEVRVNLMKKITDGDAYPEILVPVRIICLLSNMYWTSMEMVGTNHSTSGVVNNQVTTEFSISGSKPLGTFDGSASISTVYLLSNSSQIGSATGDEIDPNVQIDDNDTIDVTYKIILSRSPDVSDDLMVRLGDILRGVDQNVTISRASLYNGATHLQQTAFTLQWGGTSSSANIRFNTITSLPDIATFYIYEGSGITTKVYSEAITVDGWGSGDNVIVPFSISLTA